MVRITLQMTLTIRLSASKVASACGLNPYCTSDEVLTDVLKKYFPEVAKEDSKTEILKQMDHVQIEAFVKSTKSELMSSDREALANTIPTEITQKTVIKCIEALGTSNSVKETLVECNARESSALKLIKQQIGSDNSKEELCKMREKLVDLTEKEDSQNVEKINNLVLEISEKEKAVVISEKIKDILTRDMKSCVAKNRGINLEDKDLDNREKQTGVKIVSRNSRFYTSSLCRKFNIVITGKIDGRISDGTVIETKRRRRRLFGKIPKYEKVQLEIYMWLTQTKECIHLENFEDDTNSTQYKTDSKLWNDILVGLDEFCENFSQAVKE